VSNEVRSIEKFRIFTASKKVPDLGDNSGLTLIELLISILILSIVVVGLHQVLDTSLAAYDDTSDKQELLARGRFAMERMVRFVQETDLIQIPSPDELKVSERLLDTYNNFNHQYMPGGDGYLDADEDQDGLVNEDATDPITYVTFKLNGGNLEEELPNYKTGATGDYLGWKVIGEQVAGFTCSFLSSNVVEIQLTLNDGKNEVNLKTRAKARLLD
jgi:prepilin-type N-terminal cleavage/methylation domain-containing protein